MTGGVSAQRRGGTTYYVELPDGSKHKYVGVTTVLNEVAKPFLLNWAAEQAAKAVFDDPDISLGDAKKAHTKVRDAAGSKGTTVHSFAEAWANGSPMDPATAPTEVRPYIAALYDFFSSIEPEILYSEVIVVSDTYEYAGTADSVLRDRDGHILLTDYKTSKNVYEWENGLQLTAYRNADFIIDPATRQALPLPRIDQGQIVHLKPNGTWSLHHFDVPFENFLAYLHIYRQRNNLACPPACWCQPMGVD